MSDESGMLKEMCDECGKDYSGDEIRRCSICNTAVHMNSCGDEWKYDESLHDEHHRSGDVCSRCVTNIILHHLQHLGESEDRQANFTWWFNKGDEEE
jgi:hypothetical protein